jgi:hypothetical protein
MLSGRTRRGGTLLGPVRQECVVQCPGVAAPAVGDADHHVGQAEGPAAILGRKGRVDGCDQAFPPGGVCREGEAHGVADQFAIEAAKDQAVPVASRVCLKALPIAFGCEERAIHLVGVGVDVHRQELVTETSQVTAVAMLDVEGGRWHHVSQS